jgi:hypothetical protein
MRYWIHDRERRWHGLPLYDLVRRVQRVAGGAGSHWLVHRARGSAAELQPWLLALSKQQPLPVSYAELEQLSRNRDHSLHDLEAECVSPGLRVRFGLYDDAALFVDAPAAAAAWILAPFRDIHPSPRARSSDIERLRRTVGTVAIPHRQDAEAPTRRGKYPALDDSAE